VIDAETGMRGYVITGERMFLEPTVAAQRNLPDQQRITRERLLEEDERRIFDPLTTRCTAPTSGARSSSPCPMSPRARGASRAATAPRASAAPTTLAGSSAEMARSFNQMAASLEASHDELDAQRGELSSYAEELRPSAGSSSAPSAPWTRRRASR
jgi:hypothetical protein